MRYRLVWWMVFACSYTLLMGGVWLIAVSTQADTDGPPARMVRLGPDGTAHVGTITGMSARVGYRGGGRGRVLKTFRCRESRAIGWTWCSGRMVAGRMRVFVVYERVNQDLISYYGGNLRVFVWEP